MIAKAPFRSAASVSEKLEAILHDHPASPFLFVGSGFSRRYLGIPSWAELLRLFCKGASPFEYYLTNADSNLPRAASLIAKDFAEYWWKSPDTERLREEYRDDCRTSSSPLKIAISAYIKERTVLPNSGRESEELDALRALNTEGVITTNWDQLLEELFSGYKVYIGQQSIVRQVPQNIAEIYKIHGCVSDPNSLVLTEDDYRLFKDKQAYLAAKLITIFVEHPVVFLGYSISDPNILDLLRAILRGLGSEEIRKLQQNLIFVQHQTSGELDVARETILVVDETQLPVTNLVTDDFLAIYGALAKSKLKLPARVLRFCKEQLYELIARKEPSEKLCLVDIEDVERKEEIEFIVGIGVVRSQVGERGYLGVSIKDIFSTLIRGEPRLDSARVLEQTIPALDSRNNFLPVFVFLRSAGAEYGNAAVTRLISIGRDGYKTKGYERAAMRAMEGRDFNWIVTELPPEKAAAFIPHLVDDEIPLDALRAFADSHFEKAFSDRYSTFFRKLFCLYDYLSYGKP